MHLCSLRFETVFYPQTRLRKHFRSPTKVSDKHSVGFASFALSKSSNIPKRGVNLETTLIEHEITLFSFHSE